MVDQLLATYGSDPNPDLEISVAFDVDWGFCTTHLELASQDMWIVVPKSVKVFCNIHTHRIRIA